MADLQDVFGAGFDTNSVPPTEDFVVMPPGDYPVMVEKAEVKPTKTNTGHYISLTLQVLDGPAKGRKLFDNINIQNQNQQCEEIGRRTLSALGRAVGVPFVQSVLQLVNCSCFACVKVKDGENQVRTYKPFQQAQYQTTQPQQQQAFNPPIQHGQQPYQASPPQFAPPPQQPQPQYAPQPAPQYQQPQANMPGPQQGAPGKPPWAR